MNNQTIDTIMTRQSVRKYTDKEVSSADINIILKAAMAAPTAKNKRPYHFVVINDQTVKNELTKINPYSKMIQESSHTIAVVGDTLVEETMDFIHHDCAAAVQNILLASHTLGLGAVWVGVKQGAENGWDKHVSTVLQLPTHIKPIALIPIGHPDQSREIEDRYQAEKVHKNIW